MFSNVLDNFFNPTWVSLGDFGCTPSVRYNKPYEVKEFDDGYEIIMYALGMEQDDIKIDLSPEGGYDVLRVSGNTTDGDSSYEIREFKARINFKVDYEKLECELKNGLFKIKLYRDESKVPSVKINWK